MNKDLAFERFIDAIDARGSYAYKAGVLESWVKGLVDTYPEVHGQMVVLTQTLEKWSAEEEQDERARKAEVDGFC